MSELLGLTLWPKFELQSHHLVYVSFQRLIISSIYEKNCTRLIFYFFYWQIVAYNCTQENIVSYKTRNKESNYIAWYWRFDIRDISHSTVQLFVVVHIYLSELIHKYLCFICFFHFPCSFLAYDREVPTRPINYSHTHNQNQINKSSRVSSTNPCPTNFSLFLFFTARLTWFGG
jgi:hypothetical protein